MEEILGVGYDAVHPADFVYDVQPNHGSFLLILTSTPARFWEGDTSRIVPAHQAALFAPESRILYGACEDQYRNDWIIFTSDEANAVRFPLIGEPFPVIDPDYCHNLFQLLTWEHRQRSDGAVISQLLALLLQKFEAELRYADAAHYGRELLALRRDILNHPQRAWRAPDMAEQLHVSTGYFHALYRERFGVTCMDDVISGRCRLAREYLMHTNMNVAEIAALCGYHSTEHFSRQFRRVTGLSPGQYRKGWISGKS